MYYDGECGFDDNMSMFWATVEDLFRFYKFKKDEIDLSRLGFDNMSVYHINESGADGVDGYIFLLDGILGTYAFGKICSCDKGAYLVNDIIDETDVEFSMVRAADDEYDYPDYTRVVRVELCDDINFMVKGNYQSLREYIEDVWHVVSHMDYRLDF